ncbi:MAG: hypothetical protein ACREKH_01590 [Candidatus Rokuibacteriota bacterium]
MRRRRAQLGENGDDERAEVDVRVPVQVVDHKGVDEKGSPQAYDLSGAGGFVEVWGVDIKPNWRGGQLSINGQVTDSAGVGVTYQYALIEFAIIAYVGSQPNVIRRGVLGGVGESVIHDIEEKHQYTRLAVEARKIIDGAGGSSISPAVITISATARFNSE